MLTDAFFFLNNLTAHFYISNSTEVIQIILSLLLFVCHSMWMIQYSLYNLNIKHLNYSGITPVSIGDIDNDI